MAMRLKADRTYSYKGINIPNPYLVIDDNNGNKRRKNQHIVVEIYPKKADRNDETRVLESFSFDITNGDWTTYFSPAAIKAGDDQYSRAYEYIKTLRKTHTEDQNGVQVVVDDVPLFDDWDLETIA